MSSISAIPSCSCIFEKKLEPEQSRPSTRERLLWGERSAYVSSSKLWTRHTVQRRLTISSWMFRDWTGLNCLVGQSFSMTQSRTLTTRFQQQTFFTFGALRKNPSFKKQQLCDVENFCFSFSKPTISQLVHFRYTQVFSRWGGG